MVAAADRSISWAEDRGEHLALDFVAAAQANDVFGLITQSGTLSLLRVAEDDSVSERAWLRRADMTLAAAKDLTILDGDPVILLPENTFARYRNGKKVATYRIEGYGWQGQAAAFTALP